MHIVILGSDQLTFNGRVAKTRRLLEQQGHIVRILRLHLTSSALTTNDRGADLQARSTIELTQSRNPIIRRLLQRRRFRKVTKAAQLHLTNEAPDALHIMDPYALKVANLWKTKNGSKTAIVFDACEWFEGTAAGDAATTLYIRKILSQHSRSLFGWLTPSLELANLYQRQYPEWPAPYIFGNVPDWDMNEQPHRAKSPLREAIGVSPDDIVMVFSGALNPRRGLEALLAGAPSLPDNAHLVFLGYGALSSSLKTDAEKQAFQRVHFLPAVSHTDLRTWLAGADTGLITYEPNVENHDIATPNKLYEYPGAGVPILASDLAVIRATITSRGIGCIVNPTTLGQDEKTSQADLSALAAIASEMRSDAGMAKRLNAFVRSAQTELLAGLTDLYRNVEATRA